MPMFPFSASSSDARILRRVFCRQRAERFALQEVQWEIIRDLFPVQRRGGKWRAHRQVVEGVLLMARGGGATWRDLPPWFGPWQTVYSRYRRYAQDGTLALMLARLSSVDLPLRQGR